MILWRHPSLIQIHHDDDPVKASPEPARDPKRGGPIPRQSQPRRRRTCLRGLERLLFLPALSKANLDIVFLPSTMPAFPPMQSTSRI